jgi:hypothetical protein
MKRNLCGLLPALFLIGLLAGCGGGGGNMPPATLNITTASLPSGQTTVAYGPTTLSATGGTAPYTWSVASGSLPAGLSLSTGGVIGGTPTTAQLATFSVKAMDSAASPQTATANFTLPVSGGKLQITSTNATGGAVGTAYQFQMEASGGVPPYTWAVASGSELPAGLTISAGGLVTGTPTASGTFSPNIEVTDATTTNTATQNVNFSINPAGPPLPDGNYAFEFGGTAPSGNPVELNGVFGVQKGVVAIGFYNENVLNEAPTTGAISGAVSVPTNGLGQLELTLPAGNITFALAVPASALTAGNDSDIRIIEFDDTTGKGMRGSGVLKVSNPGASLAAIVGGYAFGFHGYDTHSQPTALAGSFQADGKGGISGGEVDINDNGTVSNYTGVTGTYTADPVGGGTITLNLATGNTVNYSFYEVSPTEILAISADMTSPTIPLVGGSVLQQSGNFSNASLAGGNVLELNGDALQNAASYTPDITLGLVTSNGSGSLTATYDEYKAGQLLSPQNYSGSYSVDPATGRVEVTATSTPPIFYLVSDAKAFVLGTDTSTSSGVLESQSGSPFTNASFKGNYLGGTIPFPETNVVSLVVANGTGGVQYTSNSSGPSGLQMNQALSGTYSVDATGRIVVSVDSTARIFYVVSPTKSVYLSGENGGYLGSFEQ